MVQRICPICDQVMKSAHYCKNCRRRVKHPYVRNVTYYLNERHPQDESGCSYHDPDSQRVIGAEHKGMLRPPEMPVTPGRPVTPGTPTSPRTNASPGTNASPDGVWQPAGLEKHSAPLSRNTSFPARVPLPPVNTVRQAGGTGMKGDRPPRSGSRAVIGLFLVAAFASAIVSFSGPVLDTVRSVLEPPAEYDIDLGDYTGEEMEGSYRELDEDDVIALGERCNTRGHFAVQGKLMEQPVQDVLKKAGFQVARQDTYSYNEAYDSGETWYTTWTSMEVEGETRGGYQYVELDFDTGTGELHEISLSLDDSERLTEVTCGILALLADQGEIDADADCFTQVAAELPGALKRGGGYNLLEGAVLIEGISYEDSYSVYISHNIDSDL